MPAALTIDKIKDRLPPRSRLLPIRFEKSKRLSNGNLQRMCLFICSCGKSVVLPPQFVTFGSTLSCGCLKKECPKNRNVKYVPYIRRLYDIWYKMVERCCNPKNKDYAYYGGRGVSVCKEWRADYQIFLDWALANGYADDKEIDKDVSGGMMYSPETCRWLTRKENMRHTRRTVRYEFHGESLTLMEVSEKTGVPKHILTDRVYAGNKTIYDAVNVPIKKYTKPKGNE